MHRRLAPCAPLLALLAAAAAGCGSSSTDPAADPGPTFDLMTHFPQEQAVASRDAGATRLRMVGVAFETASATLTAPSRSVLDGFRDVFANLPDATYAIEGHMSSVGASAYNLRLSNERAAAVRAYLVGDVDGPAAAITAIGYGEERPIDTNRTLAGRRANERIEIVVEESGGDAARSRAGAPIG